MPKGFLEHWTIESSEISPGEFGDSLSLRGFGIMWQIFFCWKESQWSTPGHQDVESKCAWCKSTTQWTILLAFCQKLPILDSISYFCHTQSTLQLPDAVLFKRLAKVMNGITGIEDRLQDEVSDTIMKMTEAGKKTEGCEASNFSSSGEARFDTVLHS